MSVIDVPSLLQDVSPDAPAGTDLSYDPAYMELERLAAGSPERQVGNSIVPAEEPDWPAVSQRCVELLSRTKDLRVAMYLARAQLQLRGLAGLHDGLMLIRGLIEKFWGNLYPQLDPDDGNDPLERLNIIMSLAPADSVYGDSMQFGQNLRASALVSSPKFGRFGLRELEIVNGVAQAADPENAPKQELLNQAFEEAPIPELQSLDQLASESIENLKSMREVLVNYIGAENAPDFKTLQTTLTEIRKYIQNYLSRRTGAPAAPVDGQSTSGDRASAQQGVGQVGAIRSTADVVAALETICQYYQRYEPSSPIPLLLRRAQRLVSKSFIEIIQDLSPGAMDQIQTISGTQNSSSA
jgi:type VI secretion system protein ImpA